MQVGEDLLPAEQEKPTLAAGACNLQAHDEAVQLQAIHWWEATQTQGCTRVVAQAARVEIMRKLCSCR